MHSHPYAGRPLFDIASFGRRGRGAPQRPSGPEMEIIRRTASRTPEVMVKVSGGGTSVNGVAAHFSYIDRHGKLELETDDGHQLKGRGVEADLLLDWNLEDELAESQIQSSGRPGRRPGKLVHNIVLSMPAGTPPDKLHAASRDFAREQFAFKNRYALVLHTDQQHPHVHLVVKAMGEDGTRLNIRKANLREWRSEFARHLRAHGVPANATERAVRDQLRGPKPDRLYRAERRRTAQGRDQQASSSNAAPFEGIKLATRQAVSEGWQALAKMVMEMSSEQAEEQSRSIQSPVPQSLLPPRARPAPRMQEFERDGFSR